MPNIPDCKTVQPDEILIFLKNLIAIVAEEEVGNAENGAQTHEDCHGLDELKIHWDTGAKIASLGNFDLAQLRLSASIEIREAVFPCLGGVR